MSQVKWSGTVISHAQVHFLFHFIKLILWGLSLWSPSRISYRVLCYSNEIVGLYHLKLNQLWFTGTTCRQQFRSQFKGETPLHVPHVLNAIPLLHHPPAYNASPFITISRCPSWGRRLSTSPSLGARPLPTPQALLHPTHICSVLVWLLAQENTVASGYAVVKVEVEEEKWIMGGLLVALRVFTCHIMWWVSMQNQHGTTNIPFVC